jgi:hypothetical protein
MRRASVMVALLGMVLFGSDARAVELEDCSKYFFQKTDCLERNIALLNSAFETVSAELRTAVKELKNAGFFAPGDKVQLQSNRLGTCADQVSPLFPTGNQDFVLAAPCTNDAQQRWTVKR